MKPMVVKRNKSLDINVNYTKDIDTLDLKDFDVLERRTNIFLIQRTDLSQLHNKKHDFTNSEIINCVPKTEKDFNEVQ